MLKCDVIKDILPLYVDDVVSDETKKTVLEHINECESCKTELENLSKNITNIVIDDCGETNVLKKVERKLKKKKYITIAISVATTFIIIFSAFFAYYNVGVVSEFFSPNKLVFIEAINDEWNLLEEEFIFDSIFYKKELVSNIVNTGNISIKIVDENGDVALEILDIEPGTKVELKDLKNNTKYKVYTKTESERSYINIV